jgi:hydroxypyruvate reductase
MDARKDEGDEIAIQMRALTRQIFLEALAECSVAKAFAKNLECHREVLRICDDLYDLRSFNRVLAITFGKAARPMAEGLIAAIGAAAQGIVVEPELGPVAPLLSGFRHYLGGHPAPNMGSQAAANAVLKSLGSQAQNALVIFLLSGGGSAMLEKPLDHEISLEDLIATHRALVYCGAPIAEINAVRKHLSSVKGGRLALAANDGGAQAQVSVMVSDVPDSSLDALASGPTMPDPTTTDNCYEIAARYKLLPELPKAVRELFERRALEETPKKEDPAFHNCRWWPVLSNRSLEQAAAMAATGAGFAVEVDNRCDDWDYARAADYLLKRVRELRKGVSRVCLISGGEVTVTIPPETKSGIGGRNQQFALHCVRQIAGENIAVLSAGSDGIDGNSEAAGAAADGTTLGRAKQLGLDAANSLLGYDSSSFFQKLHDEIVIGPTGNNIRDLRILLAW